jgi:hypothetical protein
MPSQCVYSRFRNVYTDGSTSDWVYLSSGANAYATAITSSAGWSFLEGEKITDTTVLTAHIYSGTGEVDSEGVFTYTWYKKKNGEE